MININLLEIREERRRVAARQFIVMFFGSLFITGIGIYFWHAGLAEDIEHTRSEVRRINAETEKLAKVVKDVEKIKDEKKKLEGKLEVIKGLESNRTQIVDLLLAFTEELQEEVWLETLSVNDTQIAAKGKAVDMQSIGLLVKSLKNNPHFNKPETSGIKVSGKGGSGQFVSFSLTCEYVAKPAENKEKEG